MSTTNPNIPNCDSYNWKLEQFIEESEEIGEFFLGQRHRGYEFKTTYNPRTKKGDQYPRKVFLFTVPESTKKLDKFIDDVYRGIRKICNDTDVTGWSYANELISLEKVKVAKSLCHVLSYDTIAELLLSNEEGFDVEEFLLDNNAKTSLFCGLDGKKIIDLFKH